MKKKLFFIIICFFCFTAGVVLSNRIIPRVKFFHKKITLKDDSKEKYLNDSINDLYISLKDKDYKKLRKQRDLAINGNYLPDSLQSYFKAEIKHNNQTFKTKIGLTGGLKEHFIDYQKWSFKLKLSDNKQIKGMRKFAILYPEARGFLTDWTAYKLLKARGGIALKVGFCNVFLNKNYLGLYYLEERFGNHIIKNNHLEESIIFKIKIALKAKDVGKSFNYNTNLKFYNEKNILEDSLLNSYLSDVNNLWFSFYSGTLNADEVFDLQKFATVFAISDLLNSKHGYSVHNLRFYYNPATKLIEPIAREWMDLNNGPPLNKKFGSLTIEGEIANNVQWDNVYLKNFLIEKLYKNIQLQEYYLKELDIISKRKYLDSVLMQNNEELKSYIAKIQNYDPTYNFSYAKLYENQHEILKKIYPETPSLLVKIKEINNNKVTLIVKNKSNIPQQIHEIKWLNKNILNNKFTVLPKYLKKDGQKLELIIDTKYKNIDIQKLNLEVIFSCLGISPETTNYLGEKIINKTFVLF